MLFQQRILQTRRGVLAILALLLLGCGSDRPPTAQVSGVVTFEGRPVTQGTITFYPEQGRPAIGAIDADGSYKLTTFKSGDGALLGRHRITIEAQETIGGSGPKSFEEEAAVPSIAGKTIQLVPAKYARLETSPLTQEVLPGSNQIDWKLSDKLKP